MPQEETRLNWQSARVQDATLTVELEGEVSKEWKRSFENTVRLLGGDWGEVKVKKHAVRVNDVVAGQEDEVRFFLESVVAQANASGVQERESHDDASDDAVEPEEPSGPDAEMTERFRAFSADDDEEKEG